MKNNRIDVLVAGAGPVGLTTALFLREQGLSALVADAKPRGVTHSYALALHPASLELLEAVGVLGAVLARALPVRRLGVYAGSRKVAVVPVAPTHARFPFLAVVGQDVLEAALAEALARRGDPVRWSHRLARFTQGADKIAVELDELEERTIGYAAARFDWLVKRTQVIDASFLVGADGHDSLVRRQLGLDFSEVRPAEHFAVFEFQRADAASDELSLVLHEDGVGVLWPLPGGRARWSFAVHPEKHPEAWREKDHEAVQIIGPGVYPALEETFFHRLLADRAPWFAGQVGHVYWRMLVRFERRLAASFGQGRAWLAGDAAHLTGPAGIQSMNVGLREARELARGIVRADSEGKSFDALHAYASDRQREWKKLLGLAGKVEAVAAAQPEIVRWRQELIACLPASGGALNDLAGALGLRLID